MSFFLKTTLELLSILRFEWVTVESGNTDANLLCVRSVYKTALWNNNIKNSWINAIILDYSESNPAQLTCDQLFQSIRIWRFWILQECDVYIKKKNGVKCAQILYHKNNCDVLEKISCSGYPCSWSFWMMRSLDGGIPLFIFANPVYMSES